jgi:hypothetical protein
VSSPSCGIARSLRWSRATAGRHDILSHDFVEAALMRRAGYHVWLVTDLAGSYEQQPPNLLAELQRDRRWCQGNLQNARLIAEPGLHAVHRAMLATGAMAYLSAPLWLAFVLLGATAWLSSGVPPAARVMPLEMKALWACTFAMLIAPRVLGALVIVCKGELPQYGGAGAAAARGAPRRRAVRLASAGAHDRAQPLRAGDIHRPARGLAFAAAFGRGRAVARRGAPLRVARRRRRGAAGHRARHRCAGGRMAAAGRLAAAARHAAGGADQPDATEVRATASRAPGHAGGARRACRAAAGRPFMRGACGCARRRRARAVSAIALPDDRLAAAIAEDRATALH